MSSSNLQGWSSNQPGRHSQKPLGADQTAERNSTLASTWWQKKSTRVHTDPVGSLKSNFSPTFTCGGKKKRREGPHQQGGPQTGWPGLHQVQGRQPSLCTKGDTSHEECDGQSTNGCQIFQHKRAAETEHRPQCSQRSRGSKKQRSTGGKPAIRTAHTPTHEAVEEKAAGEEKARGTTPTDTDGTPHQFLFIYFLIKLLSTPNFDGGGHTFSQEGKTSCC